MLLIESVTQNHYNENSTVKQFVNKFILFEFIIQSWYWEFLSIYRRVNMSENSSYDTDDVSDYGDEIPSKIVEAAKEVSLNLLPDK